MDSVGIAKTLKRNSANPFNPLTPDKLRINATFRQQMAFFDHFRPHFVPILMKSAF